jgi:hypothetical protein
MKVLLDPNGELRDSSSLEVVGHWFQIDDVKYYIKNLKLCSKI